MRAWSAIDAVVALEPGKSARAIRNVPSTLDVFDSHFDRFPVFPGVLVLASLAELANLLLTEATGSHWRLSAARRVRFKAYVRPGDQLDISVSVALLEPSRAELHGTVKVGEQIVVTAASLTLATSGES